MNMNLCDENYLKVVKDYWHKSKEDITIMNLVAKLGDRWNIELDSELRIQAEILSEIHMKYACDYSENYEYDFIDGFLLKMIDIEKKTDDRTICRSITTVKFINSDEIHLYVFRYTKQPNEDYGKFISYIRNKNMFYRDFHCHVLILTKKTI